MQNTAEFAARDRPRSICERRVRQLRRILGADPRAWDVAAGILLVQEAGGLVTDLDGDAPDLRAGAFVAGNPAMHAWLLQTVRRADMTEGFTE